MENDTPDARLVRRLRDVVALKDATLDLSYDRMGDEGVLLLTRLYDLSHVRLLNLGWNGITNARAPMSVRPFQPRLSRHHRHRCACVGDAVPTEVEQAHV